jgi:hypothetical protein
LAPSANAGTIDSRNGSANVAPIPRSMVRRGNDFMVMNGMGYCAPCNSEF